MKTDSIRRFRRPIGGLACAIVMLALMPVSSIFAQPATTRPDPAPAANRVTLFNGKDLDGWRIFLEDKTADPKTVWTVSDGILKLNTTIRGYVIHEGTFSNYHLHVEWRWAKDAVRRSNSGVLIHINGPDGIWPNCFENQLQVGNAGQVVGMQLDIPAAPMQQNRKRAAHIAPASEKPLGEWNTYEIYARGDTIENFVNGVRQNKVEKLPVSSGGIALQLEGFPVDFRNVWLEPE